MTTDQYPAPGPRDVVAEFFEDPTNYNGPVVTEANGAWAVKTYRPRHQERDCRGLIVVAALNCGRNYTGHHRKFEVES